MELKKYQQDTIADLERFLEKIQETKNVKDSFSKFWMQHPKTPLTPSVGTAIEPYKNNISGVPHICVKVPTAGGKTFIACNALKTIFDAFDYDKDKAVVWLVPSITILDQTILHLKNPFHPYRQKINTLFRNKVEIFDKATLLQGTGFNPSSVKDQLNIFVLSFDSLRARNKDDRKVYQENGNLQPFSTSLGADEEISLMKVIQSLNPVVIVDESHNAESELSVEMLSNLNPCFILDLTATPRKNSNIISFVDAIELKKENMVKLPVIVYNHHDKTEVINSALQLQRKLELQAIEEQKNGGAYIRPIVLFQAQPKNDEDTTTFEKLKEKLLSLHIPANQIRIKTAFINELKSEDLMSPDCSVRYIITVNALKEGWDCPFAYILASLADKSSPVDVEQILGRVLRQPYVVKHNSPLLNLCYVLTASAKFLDTLDNIVKGLNKAGFSDKDYRKIESSVNSEEEPEQVISQLSVFATEDPLEEDIAENIDTSRIMAMIEPLYTSPGIEEIESMAVSQTQEFEKMMADSETSKQFSFPSAIQQLVKTYPIKKIFRQEAAEIKIPQFYLTIPANDIFGNKEDMVLLEKENLLEGFPLSKGDTNIAFESISSELYKVDLDDTRYEHTPSFIKLDGKIKDSLMVYILDPSRKNDRAKNYAGRLISLLGKMDPISHGEIEKYITHILSDFSDEQFNHLVEHEFSYADKIKLKIRSLSEEYAEQQFTALLDTDKIIVKPSFTFLPQITPGDISKNITKSLYDQEAQMNGFEERVINEVANSENIAFWTKNIEKKGFCINGFLNHYPDFIIKTKKGKIILLETKGDHLDAEQKIRLGNKWAQKSGNQYRYCMMYERRIVPDAYTLDGFMNIIRDI